MTRSTKRKPAPRTRRAPRVDSIVLTASNQQATQVSPSPIESLFLDLSAQAGLLERRITELQERIDPILRPVPPTDVAAGSDGGAAIPVSNYQWRLATLIRYLSEQNDRLANLIDRAET